MELQSINVIAIQEIWNIPYDDILNIPGYNLVYEQGKVDRVVMWLSILKMVSRIKL